jgi:hypothetical protein
MEGSLPGWAFVGGLLLIGTVIGGFASALFWLMTTGDRDEEEGR